MNNHLFCQCDAICSTLGDCCRDHVALEDQQTVPFPDVVPGSDYWSCVPVPTEDNIHNSLMLVNSCPVDYDNASVLERCASLSGEPILTDGLGVYYYNIFCAICHGFKNTSALIEYAVYHETYTENAPVNILSHSCYRIQALHDWINPPRQCDSNFQVIQDCPDDVDSASVTSLCRQFSALVFINHIPYKNEYCAYCNGAIELNGTDNTFSCPEEAFIQVGGDINVVVGAGFVPLYSEPELLQPICPNGLIFENSKCFPQDTDWPPCEHILTSYSINHSYPAHQCFDGVGHISSLVKSIEEYDMFNNTIFTYELYDIFDYDLPNRTSLEQGIENALKMFNSSYCSEQEIALIQSCLIAKYNSTECQDNWYKDVPDAFQPAQINGSNYVYYNGTYLSPFEWINSTIYRYNDSTDDFYVSHEFQLCGEESSIMTCAAILTEDFQQVTENNVTVLIFGESYIYPNDYVLLPNGSAHVCWTSYTDSEGGSFYQRFSRAQLITSHICFGCSSLCLLATLVTYLALKPLQNLQGLSIINLVIALLLGQVLFEYPATYLSSWSALCQTVAILAHFFLLASFCWMTLLAYNCSRSFSSLNFKTRSISDVKSHILRYCLVGWFLPMVFICSCVFVHIWGNESIPMRYGNGDCWISPFVTNVIVFLVPLAISLILNAVLFTKTIRGVRASKRDSDILSRDQKGATTREVVIYIKVYPFKYIHTVCRPILYGFLFLLPFHRNYVCTDKMVKDK